MFENYSDLPAPTQRAFPQDWRGEPRREIETFWSLGGGDGVPEVRLYLSTSHDPDNKVFRSTLSWDTKEPAEPGSMFSVSSWGSDHDMLGFGRTPVDRYSKKALKEEHARAVAKVEATYAHAARGVVAQAVERNGLGQEVPA